MDKKLVIPLIPLFIEGGLNIMDYHNDYVGLGLIVSALALAVWIYFPFVSEIRKIRYVKSLTQ